MKTSTSEEVMIDEAAEWMALLQSGYATAEEYKAFDRWREADPRRTPIFRAMGAGSAVLENEELKRIPRESLLHTLSAPSSRRHFLRSTLAMAGLVSGAIFIGQRSDAWPQSGALKTGTGVRLSLTLQDGSSLTLDARSSVLPHFDSQQRLLKLLDGKLMVDVVKDNLRPFIVETRQGRMRALGTRFTVQQDERQTQIAMLHSQVEITTRNGTVRTIDAGQKATFNADGLLKVEATTGDESAWTQGLLEVRNRALGEVIESLRTYRRGIIRISSGAASLRLSGIFPLDDTDQTLKLLAKSLPVTIKYHSPYWVSIDVR
jgi:transmembrane sensor